MLRSGGGARVCRSRPSHADVRELPARRSHFGLIVAPMQLVHLLGGPGGRRTMLAAVAASLRPGGEFYAALLDDPLPPLGPSSARHATAAARRSRGRWLGPLQPAGRDSDQRRGDRDRAPAPTRLTGGRADRGARSDQARSPDPRYSRIRGRGPAAWSRCRACRSSRPTTTSAPSSFVCGRRNERARATADRALPGADEHLRRSRQRHLPAAPLRVARDRLQLRGRRAGRELRSRRARPDLHRRRPGPRPACGGRRHAGDQARCDPRPRSTATPSLLAVCGGYQLLGHSYELGRRADRGPRDRRPEDRPRAR